MTKNEMVIEVLNKNSCLTAKEIANFIWRRFNELFTPSSISGVLRPMYTVGAVAKSKNLKGETVYWLVNNSENKVRVNKWEEIARG